ncbi:MAG: serine/threonine protein phosphatase [Clostridia bacterium]|nr:serine/threonine protein phosphatase [Clostridia bacterium]
MQTGKNANPYTLLESTPLYSQNLRLYSALRQSIPVIDAAIMKIVRLTGGFCVRCTDASSQQQLDELLESINVNGTGKGIENFVSSYFEQLLTYGTAAGEIITDTSGFPYAFYNAPLENLELRRNTNGIDVDIYSLSSGKAEKVKYPQLIIISALNPDPGALCGNSLLKGLPFVSEILLKIFKTTGTNWERLGNTRFAVTYKPANDTLDRAYAKERALQVAKEWSSAMSSDSVKDFVAVGDIQIKVIGAETQIPDSEIPVRQLLEQIVAKTGLPPFLLGLSWSSTERMSSQQADALTSELEAYRRILTPAIKQLCTTCLRLMGLPGGCEVIWDDIMLQDMVEIAKAELYCAQAQNLIEEEK